MLQQIIRIITVCFTTLAAIAVQAAIPNTPLQWAKEAVNDNGQAVEHITIRGKNGGYDTFVRFSLANAGFKRGELAVTFIQESSLGKLYGQQTFARDDYTVAADRLSIRAGKHSLEVQGGVLVANFDFGDLKASLTATSYAAPLQVADRRGGDFIIRDLMMPIGKISIKGSTGATPFEMSSTGFVVHEASTATAHKVYDRMIQLHNPSAGTFEVVDYIVLPAERGARPLGFVVLSAKGKTFVGEVTKEARENEKVDEAMDYRVPYQVTVLAKRGEARAAIRLAGDKQVKREDDLADLNWAARKAISTFIHPITYTIKGTATAEVQTTAAEEAVVFDAINIRYKYAQAH